ncbi:MAG: AEC family transporter [Alphaproteobacteria bacterium]|nr:AEC family transporter [Alphaproteobacteria bacterium]
MLEVLSVTFPFFALVLAGYAAAVRRMLPIEAIPGLNTFVLYFALPCMLFRFGASTPLDKLLDAPLFLTYLGCALMLLAFSLAFSLNRRIRWNDGSFGALVAVFPNTGFMGVPLLVALLGASAAGPAIVTLTIDLVIITSLCIALSRLDSAGSHGAGVAARNALKGMLVNPMPWAIGCGALTSGLQLQWPEPALKTVGLLADAASPAALFTLGAVLARSTLRHHAALQADPAHQRPPWTDHGKVVAIKLLLHPILVLVVGTAVIALGWGLDPYALYVAVLVAALPSASNVVMLAERFGADSGRIARIVLETTALSFLTFSAAVAWLK